MSHSQVIRKVSKFAQEKANERAEQAKLAERVKDMGATARLMTMTNNPSVPQSLKDDLMEVLGQLQKAKLAAKFFVKVEKQLVDDSEYRYDNADNDEERTIAQGNMRNVNYLSRVIGEIEV